VSARSPQEAQQFLLSLARAGQLWTGEQHAVLIATAPPSSRSRVPRTVDDLGDAPIRSYNAHVRATVRYLFDRYGRCVEGAIRCTIALELDDAARWDELHARRMGPVEDRHRL